MNQDRLNQTRNYLMGLPIEADSKRYAMNFCKKTEYIKDIMRQAIQETGEHMSFGYGNVNSNICFIINNEDMFNIIKPLIQETLEKFGVDFWGVYVTFINKSVHEYPRKINLLMNEINAVSPKIIYVFDKDETNLNNLTSEFLRCNIKLAHLHFIDIAKMGMDNVEVRKELWNKFRYLINYKDINK